MVALHHVCVTIILLLYSAWCSLGCVWLNLLAFFFYMFVDDILLFPAWRLLMAI